MGYYIVNPYVRNGFLGLQYAVERAYTRVVLERSKDEAFSKTKESIMDINSLFGFDEDGYQEYAYDEKVGNFKKNVENIN